eukprot:CAMPEP_0181298184 /NCGR_PEP_ID=MMETSP1101-20121128/5646_1 /TAXON_ID=46948 /ORGANISM="Rhodomonas abbreviata, Strain Caron Lab Isolate" /LENGTH=318 /DNA_ID=CAMNT_0023403187 /DNA_START=18 /DNA_END=974 /DNA_ORIENTATION=+
MHHPLTKCLCLLAVLVMASCQFLPGRLNPGFCSVRFRSGGTVHFFNIQSDCSQDNADRLHEKLSEMTETDNWCNSSTPSESCAHRVLSLFPEFYSYDFLHVDFGYPSFENPEFPGNWSIECTEEDDQKCIIGGKALKERPCSSWMSNLCGYSDYSTDSDDINIRCDKEVTQILEGCTTCVEPSCGSDRLVAFRYYKVAYDYLQPWLGTICERTRPSGRYQLLYFRHTSRNYNCAVHQGQFEEDTCDKWRGEYKCSMSVVQDLAAQLGVDKPPASDSSDNALDSESSHSHGSNRTPSWGFVAVTAALAVSHVIMKGVLD